MLRPNSSSRPPPLGQSQDPGVQVAPQPLVRLGCRKQKCCGRWAVYNSLRINRMIGDFQLQPEAAGSVTRYLLARGHPPPSYAVCGKVSATWLLFPLYHTYTVGACLTRILCGEAVTGNVGQRRCDRSSPGISQFHDGKLGQEPGGRAGSRDLGGILLPLFSMVGSACLLMLPATCPEVAQPTGSWDLPCRSSIKKTLPQHFPTC